MASSLADHEQALRASDTTLYRELGICDADEICVDSLYSVHWNEGMRLIANCVKRNLFKDAGVWNDAWDDAEDEDEGEDYWDPAVDTDGSVQGGFENGRYDTGHKAGTGQENGQQGDQDTLKPYKKHQQNATSNDLPFALLADKYASVVLTGDDQAQTPFQADSIKLRSLINDPVDLHGSGKSLEEDGRSSSQRDSNGASQVSQVRTCTHCTGLKTFRPFASDTDALEMEVKVASVGSAVLTGVLWLAVMGG